jgi:hypothetical protein
MCSRFWNVSVNILVGARDTCSWPETDSIAGVHIVFFLSGQLTQLGQIKL